MVQTGVSLRPDFRIRMLFWNGFRAELTMIGILKKQRIFRETVKDQHTTHWDLDLLSHEQLAVAMGAAGHDGEESVTPKGAEKEREKS